jgi:hypothetical protein
MTCTGIVSSFASPHPQKKITAKAQKDASNFFAVLILDFPLYHDHTKNLAAGTPFGKVLLFLL